MQREIVEGVDTCAGKPIKAAMHQFSADLLRGCEYFAKSAASTESKEEVRAYNAACIMFAAAIPEALVNEWVSISKLTEYDEKVPIAFWDALEECHRALSMKRKWNLIATLHGGCEWDSGKDPFQSYETIATLRNELVHYKAHFLGKDEAPSKRIESLMKELGVKSNASFVEADASAWASDLLSHPGLGTWVCERIRPITEIVPGSLFGH